jgi:hypothetical protein
MAADIRPSFVKTTLPIKSVPPNGAVLVGVPLASTAFVFINAHVPTIFSI